MTRVETSLNGAWRLVLDTADAGIEERWYTGDTGPAESLDVTVPAVWDLWVPGYDGAGWYFREFSVDDAFKGKRCFLEFSSVDYYAEVWLNEHRLGGHEGGYTPFSLEATQALNVGGPNLLAVRVIDPHGPDGYGEFKPKQIPSAKEEGYFSFAGIWGDVRLAGRPPVYISDVFIQPDIRRKRITVTTEVDGGEGVVELSIDGTDCHAEGTPGTLLVDFPEHDLWSPDSPKLYTLRCRLTRDGALADEVTVRFGMREFTAKEGRFYLNGRPLQIRGVLHQPDYARTLAAPESPELARQELERAKEAGFNLVRLHIKTAPEITLELADELGLLIYEEPPIGWIQKSQHLAERCEREVREMVLRDRNHPSVVIWGMLNESGNAGYVVNGGAQLVKDDLCRLARELDPSRLVIDDSGGVNATREPARMIRPYHDEFEVFDDLHIYQRAPVDHEIHLYLRHSGDPDQLALISEFGFGGMEDLPDVIAQYGGEADKLKDARFLKDMLEAAMPGFRERGLDRIFGDFSGFTAAARELQCDAARFQIEAMLLNPKLAGYCLTQLCDAGHEFCAGVLDRWRRPKPVFETLRRVQQPLHPIVHVTKTNLVPREEINVSVTLINEQRLDERADLSLQVVGPTNQVLWKKKRGVRLPRSGREVWSGAISASGSPGRHRFVVRLMSGMKVLAANAIDFNVYEPAKPADVPIRVLDPRREWEGCGSLAKADADEPAVYVVPPLANTVRAYPAQELMDILSHVHAGAVGVFFTPPEDWNDLAQRVDEAISATSKDAVGAFLGMYHYVKLHPVFEGLPTRCLMRQPYRNTVPPKTFTETSDEDICGTFDTNPIASGNYMLGDSGWWGSDILVRRFGSGRMVFTHLRILENLGRDPVAGRLFVNLLTHFVRRSVPSSEAPPVGPGAGQWLQSEYANRVRLWMVIGMFPNWGDAGHDTAYPPEQKLDFGATYPGWYRPVSWRRWHSCADTHPQTGEAQRHLVNLQDAFTPVYQYYPRFDHGTGYAYAELHSERRQPVKIRLGIQDATKLWLNGALLFEDKRHLPHRELEDCFVDATLKQGKNAVLVKVSKMPGEFRFSLDIQSATENPVQFRWWR